MLMTRNERDRLGEEALQLLEAYEKGQHTSLLAEVDQRSKRGGLSAGTLGLAAASLVAMERFDEAVMAARGALEREPRWAWLYGTLSRAEEGRGERAKAVEAALMAVQLMPNEPAYLATLASCQRQAGQGELAIRTARQALLLDPNHAGGMNELGLALAAIGDEQGALGQFRQAQGTWPNEPEAYLNEGRLHGRAGRRPEARRAFQEALRRNPGLTEAEDRLAETVASRPPFRQLMMHLLTLSRLTAVGWAIIAFLYYLLFRLLEFLWRIWDVMLPVGRVLLVTTLVWLVGGALAGGIVRLCLRRA